MPTLPTDITFDIKFKVSIDKSVVVPKIAFIDETVYTYSDDTTTVDVTSHVRGYISITQPDGITIYSDTPDIDGSANVLSTDKPLRLTYDGKIQNGIYVFTYTVKMIGFDNAVDDIVTTKSVLIKYETPKSVIVPYTDVFTPSIKVTSETVFTQPGMVVSQSRSWNVVINYLDNLPVELPPLSSKVADLIYNGKYYDACYNIILIETTTYGIINADWCFIVDKATATLQLDVFPPAPFSTLQECVDKLNEKGYGCCKEDDYVEAQRLLTQAIYSSLKGYFDLMHSYVLRLEKMLWKCINKSNVHTYTELQPYDFDFTNPSGGNEGSTMVIELPKGAGSYTIPKGKLLFAVVINAPTPTNISVGRILGADDIYASQYANPATVFDGRILFNEQTTIYFNGVEDDTEIKLYII